MAVGHVTLVEGERVRTGVTAVVPHPGNLFQEKVAGAVFAGNAFGKLARHAFAGEEPGGSCMIVVATDAPLDARDLRRVAARAVFGLARTGSSYGQGSGDYAIAFSTSPETRVRHGETSPRPRSLLPAEAVSPLFQAVLEATEEAVYNSLLRATTVTGSGRTSEAIPIERVREALRKHGR